MRDRSIAVILEEGTKRSFASAADWPGWSRAAKTADLALEALSAYAPRYAPVAARAGIAFPSVDPGAFEIIERVSGDATTEFGAPGAIAHVDGRPVDDEVSERIGGLLDAAWTTFHEVVVAAPAELRKGPRGGGRDTAKIVAHVLEAEAAYASRIGLRLRAPEPSDPAALTAFHDAIREVLARTSDGSPIGRWPARYAARRIAWHVLDHAWEIEDRTEAATPH